MKRPERLPRTPGAPEKFVENVYIFLFIPVVTRGEKIKPTTKSGLVTGINRFWNTVDAQNCNKYINHLKKVVPRVISLDGAATGY